MGCVENRLGTQSTKIIYIVYWYVIYFYLYALTDLYTAKYLYTAHSNKWWWYASCERNIQEEQRKNEEPQKIDSFLYLFLHLAYKRQYFAEKKTYVQCHESCIQIYHWKIMILKFNRKTSVTWTGSWDSVLTSRCSARTFFFLKRQKLSWWNILTHRTLFNSGIDILTGLTEMVDSIS